MLELGLILLAIGVLISLNEKQIDNALIDRDERQRDKNRSEHLKNLRNSK